MSDFIIKFLDEFNKDLKKLKKRFPTLEEDLQTMINNQLKLTHVIKLDNQGSFPIDGIGIERGRIYKVKKFPCKSLKGKGARSGIRVIYCYIDGENKIEFIEIYYKQDKAMEDRKRIKKYFK